MPNYASASPHFKKSTSEVAIRSTSKSSFLRPEATAEAVIRSTGKSSFHVPKLPNSVTPKSVVAGHVRQAVGLASTGPPKPKLSMGTKMPRSHVPPTPKTGMCAGGVDTRSPSRKTPVMGKQLGLIRTASESRFRKVLPSHEGCTSRMPLKVFGGKSTSRDGRLASYVPGEEADDDFDSDGEVRSNQKIPEWAENGNFLRTLAKKTTDRLQRAKEESFPKLRNPTAEELFEYHLQREIVRHENTVMWDEEEPKRPDS